MNSPDRVTKATRPNVAPMSAKWEDFTQYTPAPEFFSPENGESKLVATHKDIGEAIPQFTYCIKLGVFNPNVIIEW